jgi:hypothetical protein
VHVAYLGRSAARAAEIRYALRDAAGAWTVETVDATGGYGTGISIAVDAEDRPHLVYCDAEGPASAIHYASNTGGSWVSTPLPEIGLGAGSPGLAFDRAGHPAIGCYAHDAGGERLRVAHFDGAAWQAELVDSIAQRGAAPVGVGFDAGAHPVAAFVAGGKACFAARTSGALLLTLPDPRAAARSTAPPPVSPARWSLALTARQDAAVSQPLVGRSTSRALRRRPGPCRSSCSPWARPARRIGSAPSAPTHRS